MTKLLYSGLNITTQSKYNECIVLFTIIYKVSRGDESLLSPVPHGWDTVMLT